MKGEHKMSLEDVRDFQKKGIPAAVLKDEEWKMESSRHVVLHISTLCAISIGLRM